MWIFDKITQMIDYINGESDEIVDSFIERQYYRLMQFSALYLKLDKGYRFWSFLQLLLYLFILSYHWFFLLAATLVVIDIEMVLFSQVTHFCLLFQLTFVIIIFIQTKHRHLALFHKLSASDFFDYGEDLDIGQDVLRSSAVRERNRLSVIPVAVALAASAVLILSPIVDKNLGTFDYNRTADMFNDELPFPFMIFLYSTKDGLGFYSASVGQALSGGLLTAVIGSGGFLFITMSQSLTLQLRILHNSLDNIEVRAAHLCSQLFRNADITNSKCYEEKNFSYCYSKCLRKNFQHHQVILKSFEYFVEIFSMPIFASYMTGTIVIALSLISTGSKKELPGTTLAAFILCGVEVGYMFLFSVFGQKLDDLSQQLRFKIYVIKWYYCNNQVKSNLRIFQAMTLRPLTLMVGGIVPANMETFTKVMNSAYSYYNLVNAFSEN